MIPTFLARRRTSACQGPSRPRSEPDPSAEETALRAAAAQPAGLRAPLPPGSPGAWGGGGRGPSGTPSRLRGKISATLCSCSRQSAGRSPGRGRDCQGGWSLAPHPRFPRALKPALASVPRGHGSPVGLGTLPASRFVAQASRGLARSAKGSKPESRGLPSRSARLPSWGSPRRSWGGKGGWAETAAGRSPAELEASGSDNSNNGAVAVRLASQSPRGRPSVPKSRN